VERGSIRRRHSIPPPVAISAGQLHTEVGNFPGAFDVHVFAQGEGDAAGHDESWVHALGLIEEEDADVPVAVTRGEDVEWYHETGEVQVPAPPQYDVSSDEAEDDEDDVFSHDETEDDEEVPTVVKIAVDADARELAARRAAEALRLRRGIEELVTRRAVQKRAAQGRAYAEAAKRRATSGRGDDEGATTARRGDDEGAGGLAIEGRSDSGGNEGREEEGAGAGGHGPGDGAAGYTGGPPV